MPTCAILLVAIARGTWKSLSKKAWNLGTHGPSSGVTSELSGQGRKHFLSRPTLSRQKKKWWKADVFVYSSLAVEKNEVYWFRMRLFSELWWVFQKWRVMNEGNASSCSCFGATCSPGDLSTHVFLSLHQAAPGTCVTLHASYPYCHDLPTCQAHVHRIHHPEMRKQLSSASDSHLVIPS